MENIGSNNVMLLREFIWKKFLKVSYKDAVR